MDGVVVVGAGVVDAGSASDVAAVVGIVVGVDDVFVLLVGVGALAVVFVAGDADGSTAAFQASLFMERSKRFTRRLFTDQS